MVSLGPAERRVYDALLEDHFAANRQMAFVSGPRQVGKTTTCRRHADAYHNWDNLDDRALLLAGPAALADRLGVNRLSAASPVALFDELHKFPRWKPFLNRTARSPDLSPLAPRKHWPRPDYRLQSGLSVRGPLSRIGDQACSGLPRNAARLALILDGDPGRSLLIRR